MKCIEISLKQRIINIIDEMKNEFRPSDIFKEMGITSKTQQADYVYRILGELIISGELIKKPDWDRIDMRGSIYMKVIT